MIDKYCCYYQLAAHKREGEDYKISKKFAGSRVCVISPHGGGIEPGVSELVRAIAGTQFSWYLFEGTQEGDNFEELHIRSDHFDEPDCLEFVSTHQLVLALHGCKGKHPRTYLGGHNGAAKEQLKNCLQDGFKVPSFTPLHFRGVASTNICNKCAGGVGGVQLEITEEQRKRFFQGNLNRRADRRNTTDDFKTYVGALRRALRDIEGRIE